MAPWLSDTSSWLELVLNIFEAIAIIISVITFLYLMFNKFSIALRRILSPLGLGPGGRLRALIICRQNQNKKRLFIEYAILETGGNPIIRKDWKTIISSFKSFYATQGEEEANYSLKNITILTKSNFSSAISNYFDYFNIPKVRRAFGIRENLSFLMNINIEETYAMPTCLLNGLLSSYDENWEEFIRQFVSTAYSEDKGGVHQILPDELYYTFNWLLWGPSYELEYRNGLWGGLCQLSYGDESISIPAIADATKSMKSDSGLESTIAKRLADKFIEKETVENGRYGALISAKIKLYDEIPFYKSFEKEINPHNSYFYEKIKNDELPYGVKIIDFVPITNYKSLKYYSTAYVWVLFIEESNELDLFHPEKCVAFYEHANVADKQTYQFLVGSLINKSIYHFKRLFDGVKYRDRKYRFLLAMNDRIEAELKKTYQELIDKDDEFGRYLKEHISFENKFSPTTIFRGFDDYFAPNKKLIFEEVDIDNKKTLVGLGEFYTDVYMDVFPIEDERESFDNILGYLRLNKENQGKDYVYHVLLAKDENNRIVGGCIFDYYVKSNSATIEFLAIKEEKQSGGYGSMVYNEVLRILNNDAILRKKIGVDHILIEINNPSYSKEGNPLKYLYFWNKYNFKHINMDYIQPALEEGKDCVTELWLAYHSPKVERENPKNPIINEVDKGLVFDIISDYFKYAMKINTPKENEIYKKMFDSIKEKDISLSDIIKR